MVLLLINMVASLGGLRLASWALVGGGAFLSLATLVQLATGADFGGLAAEQTREIVSRLNGPRAAGLVGEPNIFAQILVPVVPIALYRAWDEKKAFWRLVSLVAAVLIGVVITLTYSRAGLVALLAAIGLAALMQRSRPRRWLAVILVLALIGLSTPWAYWQRMQTLLPYPFNTSIVDDSLQLHAVLWQVGALIFLEHPLTGVGKDGYAAAYATYSPRLMAPVLGRDSLVGRQLGAENIVVRIAAETGLLGLATWSAAVAAAIFGLRRAKRRWHSQHSASAALLLEAIEIGLYAYLVAALFQDDSYPRYLWLLVALALIGRRALGHGDASSTASETAATSSSPVGATLNCTDAGTG
jgi:O-antigen ligase